MSSDESSSIMAPIKFNWPKKDKLNKSMFMWHNSVS